MKNVYRHLRKSRFNFTFWIVCAVEIILGVLAFLQYQWIEQVSQAERERLKESLRVAMNSFARDFEQELFHPRLIGPPIETFNPEQSERDADAAAVAQFARQYASWRATSRNPALIRELLLAKVRQNAVELLKFDPREMRLESVEWPSELSRFREFLVAQSPFSEIPGLEDIPAAVFPFGLPLPINVRAERQEPLHIVGPRDWEIVRFDRKSFQDFLAHLVEQNFPRNGSFDYDVMIVQKESNMQVYPAVALNVDEFQASADDDLPLDLHGGVAFSAGMAVTAGPVPGPAVLATRPLNPPVVTFERAGRWPESTRGWQLYAKHHSGSLDSFASQFRARNLAISLAAFLLLALALIFTFISSQRTRSMAKLELEFASGLSHELRTPLAVVRSAGYQLVHGDVNEKEKVVRYGTMILNEGARLSEMVEQALLFAQTQSGRSTYKRTAVEAGAMIEDAIASCRELLPMRSCSIHASIDADLPLAFTDEKAFKHCLRNLLVNAVKYSEAGGAVEVAARPVSKENAVEIEITITNRGKGIDAAELPHIFLPFFRGKNAAGIPGSGLGLYMVRSIVNGLGGRVVAASAPNETRFSLCVPAVDI